MKKLLILTLAAALSLSLAACGSKQSEAAKAADDLISEIGEVTLDSESAILAAEQAVSALSSEDQDQLKKEKDLTDARTAYDELVLKDKAADVEEVIAAIGTVTKDSGSDISAARAAYDGAGADVQGHVGNYADLEAAEKALTTLMVDEVSAQIAAIGEVTLDSRQAIADARETLDALPAEAKSPVLNAGILTEMEERLDELQAAEAQRLLSSFRKEEDVVRGMAFYYSPTQPQYIDTRSYVFPYIGKQGDNVWLRLMYNYTGDDWVFWKKLTIAVDDERYYKTVNYFDVVHDNDNGVVWEYIDLDPTENDIDVLWAIAGSDQTIIRFEGDNKQYDLTVLDSDKAAIRDEQALHPSNRDKKETGQLPSLFFNLLAAGRTCPPPAGCAGR